MQFFRLLISSILLLAALKLDVMLPMVLFLCDYLANFTYLLLAIFFESVSITERVIYLGNPNNALEISPVCSGLTFVASGWALIIAIGGKLKVMGKHMLYCFIFIEVFNVFRLFVLSVFLDIGTRPQFNLLHEFIFPNVMALFLLMFLIYRYDWLSTFEIELYKS